MQKIKVENMSGTKYFEIPWEWISRNGLEPNLNDLEAVAERGRLNAYLFRKRMAEVPEHKIKFTKKLYRYQLKEFLKLIRDEKLLITYFDHYADAFIKEEFYIPKPKMPVYELPKDNNTDNILYAPFDLELIAYAGINQ